MLRSNRSESQITGHILYVRECKQKNKRMKNKRRRTAILCCFCGRVLCLKTMNAMTSIMFVSELRQVGGFLQVSYTNKTDRQDITEVLLNVALKTRTQNICC
jgi:hypothetical protein